MYVDLIIISNYFFCRNQDYQDYWYFQDVWCSSVRVSCASVHPPRLRRTPFKGGIDVEIYRLDVTLVGANPNAEVVFEEATGYYENYYLAHTGENGVIAKGYNKITYKNIYPNIDFILYTARDLSGASGPTPTPPKRGSNIFLLKLRFLCRYNPFAVLFIGVMACKFAVFF